MSSILSTQNRHTFLRRKYCFLPAVALSPPVGRMEPLIGLPPLVSAMVTPYPQLPARGLVQRAPKPRAPGVQARDAPARVRLAVLEERVHQPPRVRPRTEGTAQLPVAPVSARRAFHALSCACRSFSASRRCAR